MDNQQRSSSFCYPETLVHLLRQRAEHLPEKRAFTYLVDGESEELHLTYQELDTQARAIGAWLESLGLEGERALLLYPPGLEFITAFMGCVYAGVTAVPTNPPRRNAKLSRIEAIVSDAEARVALTTEDVLDRIHGVLTGSEKLKRLTWQATNYGQAGMESEWKMPDIDADTLAFLQYTSGSTGTPKGVMLTHGNLMHNSALICHAFENTRSRSGVFWLPSYHDMGLIGGILQPMYVGLPNVLMSPMAFLQKPFRWLKAITDYRGSTSGGPNFAYDLCVEKITPAQLEQLDLSSWLVAFNGAEPVRAETIDRFCEKFEPCGFRREAFYPCYGMAEATLLVTGGYMSKPPIIRAIDGDALAENRVVPAETGEHVRRLVGCGGSLPDQDVVIADPKTLKSCPPDQIGEIWVRGASVALGYLKQDEESVKTFQARLADTGDGPYLRTGDLGFLLDGELFVTGRVKDLIILRGKNYYPQDIEQTLGHCHRGLVADAVAAFVVGNEGEESLVVVQEVERSRDRDPSGMIQAIRRAVADEHDLVVGAVVLVKTRSIPKTSSGKIQRFACRDKFLDGSLNVVESWRLGEPLPEALEPPPEAESSVSGPAVGSSAVAAASSVRGAPGSNGEGSQDSPGTAEVVEGTPQEIVFREIRRVGKERTKDLSLDSNIVHSGLDSLERMEIVASLEEIYGRRFPESVLAEMYTCREVVEAVEKYLGTTPRAKPARQKKRDIPVEYYEFSKFPEYESFKAVEQLVETSGFPNPYFSVHEQVTRDTTVIGGKTLINFSSFNYLGMSGDPVVSAAAKAAIDRYGTSTSASRLVSGEKVVHRELEAAIADLVGTDTSIAFPGGNATNVTTVGHLLGAGDLILHDALVHNSIVQGAILSGARRRPFPHNDYEALDDILKEIRHEYRRVLIAIEGVYSMDGDFPLAPAFVEIKNRHKCLLMIDEAHSIGTMGSHGRGIGEHFGMHPSDVEIWMGTLSKAFGAAGGYIAGAPELIKYLKYTAPGFVFATGQSPPDAAAALAAIRLLEEEPTRVAALAERSRQFVALARERGINTGASSGTPVVPVILGNSKHSLAMAHALRGHGINVQPILHPAVEEKSARLRFFISSVHTADQVQRTVDATAEELAKIDPAYLKKDQRDPFVATPSAQSRKNPA